MTKQMIGVLGAVVLVLGVVSPAGAATFVDITYDLSETTILNSLLPECAGAGGCVDTEILGGSMKIRYPSNSATSMPILHGTATLQSMTLHAHVAFVTYAVTNTTKWIFTTASLNIGLVSPALGSLLSGGTLTFPIAQFAVTGSRHCPGHPITSGACLVLFGTLTSLVGPLGPYTGAAALSFAASAGPNGGAQSTRHTVSGAAPVYAPTKFLVVGYRSFATGVNILGREILREAEGHDPKVTPEPGTLLLLGAGTAGLALVGRATRRSQR